MYPPGKMTLESRHPSSLTAMIELRNLQKTTGQRTAVDISMLKILAGQVVGLVGPVGSGKSELLAMLTGKSRPSTGTLLVADLDPKGAVTLQQKGIGEDRKRGFGLFIPHKGIKAVGEMSEKSHYSGT